jgi:hypothetical protein
MIKSAKGTPIKTIQGTSGSVSNNVLWYKGNTDNGFANR